MAATVPLVDAGRGGCGCVRRRCRTSCAIDGASVDKTVRAGAHGGRWRGSPALSGMTAVHELSHQTVGGRGVGPRQRTRA